MTEETHGGVVGNERLTALAGEALLMLLVVEVLTMASMRALLSVHVFVGVLLAGPLALKFGGTGYRSIRYYTRAPAYVRKGPPCLPLRLLAPLLVPTTLLVVGSGIGLVVTGPGETALVSRLLHLHVLSALLWLPLLAIHAVAYLRRTPHLIAEDWRAVPDAPADPAAQTAEPAPAAEPAGREWRLGVSLGALLLGAIAALLVLPTAAPWVAWTEKNETGPGVGFFIVGLVLAALAVLAARPWRWERMGI